MGSVVAATSRSHPVSHPTVDGPICPECHALENTFFDPACKACRRKLQSGDADIAHVFAVLRQWVPQVGTTCNMMTFNRRIRMRATMRIMKSYKISIYIKMTGCICYQCPSYWL